MKKIILTAMTALTLATPTLAQDKKPFTGAYVGAEVGVMDSEFYYGGLLGYRKQTNNDWVWGLEGNVGKYDIGDLEGLDASLTEYGASAIFGKAMGKGLLFATGGVNILDAKVLNVSESDTGFKVGGGYEYKFNSRLSARAKGEYVNHGSGNDDIKGTFSIIFNF